MAGRVYPPADILIMSKTPTPEEFQKQLEDFMKKFFPGAPGGSPFTAGAATSPQETEPAKDEPEKEEWQFDYKPKDVKTYLDRFVIKQDEAKKVLSVALCDHYHAVRMSKEEKEVQNYAKQNILLVGPTGVGKTYLIRSMADLIGVPFVKADATKFSETGYVGSDVEDLVRDLVRQAEGDVERAEYGIIYIDEIDKIAGTTEQGGRDVSGRGVQTNLLKLMEETEVPARAPNDLSGQIQSMMDFNRGKSAKKAKTTINTRHILFVVSGAFQGMEKIVSRRLKQSSIGFAASDEALDADENLLAEATTRDFIEGGFEPEFIGRLPVRVVCHPLNTDDLFKILKSSEGSIIRQYEQSFSAYDIEVLFQDDGMRRIAELAAKEKTGARGLMTVCEHVFRELKFELPSSTIRRFVVSQALVDDPGAALAKLLESSPDEESALAMEIVNEWTHRFEEAHGLAIRLTPAAVERVASMARKRDRHVREICEDLFKDFQFGLKLINQNTGQREFDFDAPQLDAPSQILSDWVVASYRKEQGGQEGD